MKQEKTKETGTVRITGLPPIVDECSRILVLGSMPGEASLRVQQYYGNPRNHFWRLLYALLDGGEPEPEYEGRIRFARANGIALWDVLNACEREGSLDSAIRRPEANDFAAFLTRYPGIRHIFFNGSAAAELFRRKVALNTVVGHNYGLRTLPSTSPARAMSFEAKREAWEPVRSAWLLEGD